MTKAKAKPPEVVYNAPLINLAGPSAEAVNATKAAIMDILNVQYVSNEVRLAALELLGKSASGAADNIIQNCVLGGK